MSVAPNVVDDETTPLIPPPTAPGTDRTRDTEDASDVVPLSERPVTPLPKVQMGIICLIRVVEPICFQVIFPFINQMLLDVGAAEDPDSVGYAAGLVESIFSITQMLTIFHWGTASDRWGRKPVLIAGCIGSAISAVAFGLSRSFTMVIITRSLNGVMNGNIAVLKSIVGEISDETNEARAFSYFPLCLNIGILIASFIGGTFGSAVQYPSLLKALPLFETYPYLLPNLLAALLPLAAAILAWIYLEETLPSKAAKRGRSDSESSSATVTDVAANDYGSIKDDDPRAPARPAPSFRDLLTPHINALMFSFAILSLLAGAAFALLPLFCFTPVADGGLSFSEEEIGYAISVRSVSTIAVQVLAFPWLQRKVGSLRLFRWMMVLWVPSFALMPVTNGFARVAGQKWLVWTNLTVASLLAATANMAFVCNLLMTNAAAPSRELLGAINGYSQVVQSFVRIIGPGGASVLFAVSIRKHLLGGNLVWIVFIVVSVVGVLSGLLIKEQRRVALR